jgi:hypothetical protein
LFEEGKGGYRSEEQWLKVGVFEGWAFTFRVEDVADNEEKRKSDRRGVYKPLAKKTAKAGIEESF